MKGKVPGPAAENDPQIPVTDPPPCFIVGFKFCLRNSSFDFLQTYGLPSDPNILNLLSSVNNTCFQETSCTPLIDWGGRGSLVVKVTDSCPPCHEFDPRTAKDPPCRGAMHVNCRELKLPLVGVVWYLGYGVPTQVSASSLDYVSKLRATRGLLATDLVTLNYGQVTRTTPELPPPSSNYHINGRTFELYRFNVVPLHGRPLENNNRIQLMRSTKVNRIRVISGMPRREGTGGGQFDVKARANNEIWPTSKIKSQAQFLRGGEGVNFAVPIA
ncbi:hypothetical protein TNCV_4069761 [Trichonephila clavipes]|nr:hypothetical protein TNCV_4069761 [Trichonephila clavipes]